MLAAIRRGTPIEYVMMIGSLIGVSMPVFWIGLMLIYWLGAQAGWFPLSSVPELALVDGLAGFLREHGVL